MNGELAFSHAKMPGVGDGWEKGEASTIAYSVVPTGGGGGYRGIQIRRSVQIWSKIRDPTMVLSKFASGKSSAMKSQSRIRPNCKLNPQSEPKY
jgi:hypothetical protein